VTALELPELVARGFPEVAMTVSLPSSWALSDAALPDAAGRVDVTASAPIASDWEGVSLRVLAIDLSAVAATCSDRSEVLDKWKAFFRGQTAGAAGVELIGEEPAGAGRWRFTMRTPADAEDIDDEASVSIALLGVHGDSPACFGHVITGAGPASLEEGVAALALTATESAAV
jgi:hypothetical protein